MLTESIFLIIFVCSFGGILFISARKITALNSLPKNGSADTGEYRIASGLENKIRDALTFFEKQILLHKFLSWVKVMTMKIETRIDVLLHKIRRKAQQIDKEIKDKR